MADSPLAGDFDNDATRLARPQPSDSDATRLAGPRHFLGTDDDGTRIAPRRDAPETRLARDAAKTAPPQEALPDEFFKIGDRIGPDREVLSILRGGLSAVYICYDHAIHEIRIVKGVQKRHQDDHAVKDLFVKEAETWIRLERHPHIVSAWQAFWLQGLPWVSAEYVAGKEGMGNDLRGWLGHPDLNVPKAVEFGLHIAQGMQHAAAKVPGLVHRDLKPANILVDGADRARVTDFGLASAREAGAGTPAYMAPEQWQGSRIDQRTDLYAYGAILYEMLTGHRLFAATTEAEWEAAHTGPVPCAPRLLNPAIPAALESFVLACLAKSPADRPADWDVAVDTLAHWFHALTGRRPVLDFSAYEMDAVALSSQGDSFRALGWFSEALAAYDRAIAIKEDEPSLWNRKGIVLLYALKRPREALDAFERAIALSHHEPIYWNNKGDALLVLDRSIEALESYDRAIGMKNDVPLFWHNKSKALGNLRRYDEALAALEAAITLRDDVPALWNGKGNALFRLGRFDDAIVAYDRAIALNDNDPDYLNNKGLALHELKRVEDALSHYEQAITHGEVVPEYWNNKGNALYDLGRIEEALAAYDRAVALNANEPSYWANRSRALQALDRPSDMASAAVDMASALVRALTEENDEPEHAIANVASLGDLKHHEEALATFDRAIGLNETESINWSKKGDALYGLERWGEALAAYDGAIARKDDEPAFWNSRGNTLTRLKRFDEALTAYEKAIALNGNEATYWNNKGKVLASLEQYDQANLAYDAAIALTDNEPLLWNNKGNALRRLSEGHPRLKHHLADALLAYERAIALDQSEPIFWLNAGKALRVLERFEDALATYDRLLELDPTHSKAWVGKGAALWNLGRREDAVAAWRRSIDPRGDIAEAWYLLAEKLWNKYGCGVEGMLAAIDCAIELKQDEGRYWRFKADTLFRLQRHEETLSALEKAISLGAEDEQCWRLKGLALLGLRRFEEAIVAFEHVVLGGDEIEMGEAWENIGAARWNLGQEHEAVAAWERGAKSVPHLMVIKGHGLKRRKGLGYAAQLALTERAIALDSNVNEGWWTLAETLGLLGRHEDALVAFDHAIAQTNGNPNLWMEKGDTLKDLKRFDEAVVAYERAIAGSDDERYARAAQAVAEKPDYWYNKGEALRHLKRYDEALAAYERAIALKDDEPDYWNNKAIALEHLKRYEEALAAIERAIALKDDKPFYRNNRQHLLTRMGRAAVGPTPVTLLKAPTDRKPPPNKPATLTAGDRIAIVVSLFAIVFSLWKLIEWLGAKFGG